jgi:exonuclease SbcD
MARGLRILHTADWHLGCTLGDGAMTRTDEHAAFLDWLVGTLEVQRIDVLLVAGDIFDLYQPSAEAQSLYFGFLARASALPGLRQIVVVGGNHDSASRLDAPAEVMRALKVTVVGGYRVEHEDRCLVEVRDAQGEPMLVVGAVPYVHEFRLGADPAGGQSLTPRFRALYDRLAEKAEQRWPGVPRVATGHMTVAREPTPVDGHATDEEHVGRADAPQEIHRVGTLGAMPPEVFGTGWQYIALGHIHRGYPVRRPDVWYSGTPVAVNFGEPVEHRRVLLVELPADGGPVEVTSLAVPVRRAMRVLKGTLEQVLAQLPSLEDAHALPPLLMVEVRTQGQVAAGRQAIQDALEREFVDASRRPVLVEYRAVRVTAAGEHVPTPVPLDVRLTPREVFVRAWLASQHELPDAKTLAAFDELLTEDNV